jgi:crotonobetainyl-CoA:carnitine CoA-transferase CaiB-like acyl-CoA transferase
MQQPIPAELPLTGLTVVELGHSVAAPFAGHVFADLGARLVKIEKPGEGDDTRSWGPPFWHGAAATFQALNRNKNSVVIDLKDSRQLEALKHFIFDEADIVFQNMRPGLVRKLGLDAGSLRGQKPVLIYCNMHAFGAKGPLASKPGYDPLMQAFGGIMSITGEEGRPPVRVGPSLVDVGTGMWTVVGILSALRRRDLTGEGCEIDTSLYETSLSWVNTQVAGYLASGRVPQRRGTERPGLVPYKVFEASDGYVLIAAGNDNLFRRLAAALECPQWLDDGRFATNPERVRHRSLVNQAVQDVIATRTRAEWFERLEASGVTCAPLQTLDQVVAHPQTAALEMLQQAPDGPMSLIGLPVSFNGRRPPLRRSPPGLGADTDMVIKRK